MTVRCQSRASRSSWIRLAVFATHPNLYDVTKFVKPLMQEHACSEIYCSETCTVPPVTAPPDGPSYDVVPSLMDLLSKAMEKVEADRGTKKAAHKALADHLPVKAAQVRRYLRKDGSSPPARELDALVMAVAAETGAKRLDYWRQALANVEDAVKARGGDPRQEAAEGAALAPPPEHDAGEPQ